MLPMVPCMDFGAALNAMREHDQRMTREDWGREDEWVTIQWPDEHSKMRMPYLYQHLSHGGMVPWTPSQVDVLSTDWRVVL